ncbi:MAG TPA: MMPL family transporter [Sphaerochaeta sp.]|nr:MMPL family transporter [Sphaerochaeta sp.]
MKGSFLHLISKYAVITIALVVAITGFFLYHALFLTLDADYTSLLTKDEINSTYQGGVATRTPIEKPPVDEVEELDEPMGFPSSYMLLIESPTLYTAEALTSINEVLDALSESPYLASRFSLFDFVTLEKRGTRLMSVPFASSSWTDEEAVLLKERVQSDPMVKNYLVSEDLHGLFINFESVDLTPQMETELREILQPLVTQGMSVSINGAAILTNVLMRYLSRDLVLILTLCLLAILVVYYLSFRAKRSVLLPFSMSAMGIIWTFGTMRLLGYSLTIVNIITPAMVLNLGSSYAIHVISEYFAGHEIGRGVIASTRKILRTILFACLTTVIGFLSLLTSKTGALKEFGISVAIGITSCAILAATYLPAVLSLVRKPKVHHIKSYRRGYLASIVNGINVLVGRYRMVFVVLWLVIIAGFGLTRDKISVNTNYMSYLPKRDPFTISSRHFARTMSGNTPYYITIDAPSGTTNFFLEPENLARVYAFEEKVKKENNDIRQSLSFASYVAFANEVYSNERSIPSSKGLLNLLSRMVLLLSKQGKQDLESVISSDGNTLTIILQNYDAVEEEFGTIGSAERIEDTILDNLQLLPGGTIVTLDGEPHQALHFSNTLLHDQQMSIYFSFIFVFLVVLIAFRSFSLACYALIPVVTGVMANYIIMFLLNIPFDLITVSFGAVSVGVGVDYAIHFLLRYRNKIDPTQNRDVALLLKETISETGRPIILTTLSIVAGMLMFLFASYAPVRIFGILMSTALLNCMLATLFIMPSVIWAVSVLKERGLRRRLS